MSNYPPIEYKYLNFDRRVFCQSQSDLSEQIGAGGILTAIPHKTLPQVLIVGAKRSVNEFEAIFMCRRLSGLDRAGNEPQQPPPP